MTIGGNNSNFLGVSPSPKISFIGGTPSSKNGLNNYFSSRNIFIPDSKYDFSVK
jgi:hypothetical protein